MTSTTTAPVTDALADGGRRLETVAFAGPDSLRVRTAPTPPGLGPGDARVRVLASSLTLSDSIVRRGLNPYADVTPPFTLGYDFVGRVEEVREPSSGLRPGDLVAEIVRAGGNADVVVRPAAGLTRVGTGIEPVLLEPLVMTGVTAWQSLRAAGAGPGRTVLVHGATGGVGLLATELGVLLGARVLATGSPRKHAALAERGAFALDGRAADLPERVRGLAPEGVDAVIDGVGGPSRALVAAALRTDGVLVAFGYAGPAALVAGRTPEAMERTAQMFAEGRAVLDGVVRGGGRAVEIEVGTARDADRPGYDADLRLLAEHVVAGRLRPLVERVAFADAPAAHARLDAGAVTGRLVLDHLSGTTDAGGRP